MKLGDKARRRLWIVGIVLVALGSLALWVHRQMRPEILTPMLLKQVGDAQGLDLRIHGEPDYALRPEPRLLLPGLEVRAQGSDTPWLKAQRAEISLPWDTLTGGAPVITRIELDRPVLDVPKLFVWLDSRPPRDEPLSIPTLTGGLRIEQGEIIDTAFSLRQLDLELPSLQAGSATQVEASGRLHIDKADYPITLSLRTTPQAEGKNLLLSDSELSLQSASPIPDLRLQGQWRLGSSLVLQQSGELRNWPKDWPALPAPLSEKQPPFPISLSYSGANDFSDVLRISLAIPEHPIDARLRIPALRSWLADSSTPLPPIDAEYATRRIDMDGVTLSEVEIEIHDDPPATASDADDADR